MYMEFIPLIIKQVPTFLSLFAIFLVYIFYKGLIYYIDLFFFFHYYIFLNNKWFFDQIYNFYIGIPFFQLAYNVCYKLIDKGFLEMCGPFGISNIVLQCTKFILKNQTGFVYNYTCLFILGFFFLFGFVEFFSNV